MPMFDFNKANMANKISVENVVGAEHDIEFKNATAHGDLLPDADLQRDLGSAVKRFQDAWIETLHLGMNTLYLGDTPIMGTDGVTVNIATDPDQHIVMKTCGVGTSKVISENGVEMSTSGMNADVILQALGAGSRVVVGSNTSIIYTAPETDFNGNMTVTGHSTFDTVTFNGNVVFNGDQTIVDSTVVAVEDNIVLLNKGEVGSGVTAGQSGFRVDRGELQDQLLLWDETIKSWVYGTLGGPFTIIPGKDSVDANLASINNILSDIGSTANLHTENKQIVGSINELHTEIDGAAAAISLAEGRLAVNEGAISGLDSRVGVNEGDIDSLESRMDTAESNITSNGSDISALDSRMGAAETAIISSDGDISALGGRMTTAESDIDTLDGKIKYRQYSSLEDLGITTGEETSIEQIVEAMADYSELIASIGSENSSIYPNNKLGELRITRINGARTTLHFQGHSDLVEWAGNYNINTEPKFEGWKKVITDDGSGNVAIPGTLDIGSMADVEGEINSAKSRLDSVEAAIVSNDSDISALDSRVGVNEGDIAALDGKIKYRQYSSLEDLGITTGEETSIAQIVETMDENSFLITKINGSNNQELYPNSGFGELVIYRIELARVFLEFSAHSTPEKWLGDYYFGDNPRFEGWVKVVTDDGSGNVDIPGTLDIGSMADVESEINSAKSRLTVNEGDIDALESGVGTVASLQTAAGDLVSAVNEVHSEGNAMNSRLTTAEANISSNEGDIAALQSGKVDAAEWSTHTRITSGADLDVYFLDKKSGVYSGGTSHINKPSGDPGIYVWEKYNDSYGRLTFKSYSNSLMYSRELNNEVWGNWVKIYNEDYKPTPAEIGAEPAFTKSTGFNKDLGTGPGTVAEGDHTHTPEEVGAVAATDWSTHTRIPDDTDLDTYFPNAKNGVYSGSGTLSKAPVSESGMYIWEKYNSGWGRLTFKGYSSSKTYTKTRSNNIWGDWVEFYTEGNKPTPAEIGALADTGGFSTGQLRVDRADGATIGGTDLANADLLIGAASNGIGIDDNEFFKIGGNLIIGTLDSSPISFKPGNVPVVSMTVDGLHEFNSRVWTAATFDPATKADVTALNTAIAESAYGIKYSWADAAARDAETGMVELEQGVQIDTRIVYRYDGASWVEFYHLDAIHNHDDRYYTEAESDALLAGKSDTGHGHTAADVGAMPISGGIFTDHVKLVNGKSYYVRKIDGTNVNAVTMGPDEKVSVGSINVPLKIHSSVDPVYFNGLNAYKIYHQGNKPKTLDIDYTINNLTAGTYTNCTLLEDYYLCDCSAGDVVIESIDAGAQTGKTVIFKKTDSSANKVILRNAANGGFVEAPYTSDIEIVDQYGTAEYVNI